MLLSFMVFSLFSEQISSIPEKPYVPNKIDNTDTEAAVNSNTLDASSPKKQPSSDTLDEALESVESGSDKETDNITNENKVVHEEVPVIDLVTTEPPPLTENSEDENEDDDADFFDTEDKKE